MQWHIEVAYLMAYKILALGLSDALLRNLEEKIPYELSFSISLTIQETGCLLHQQVFHLLVVDLEYVRSIQQPEWLMEIRHTSFIPVIVLSDTPERDSSSVIQFGADMCISSKQPPSIISDLMYAQLRRYTEYNYYKDPCAAETAPFRVGDIYIDPPHRKVKVRNEPVDLRPREFSMLLYFMQNPKIVLTAEQICTNAWGIEGGYNKGIYQPVRILRQAIEPDPKKPIYIETIWHIGYRFTAHNSETCDKC